jgi:Flp pilus assembly protein TadG
MTVRGERCDAGSVTVELTVLAPVVLALLLFTVGLGRISDAGAQVSGAARDAARAASRAPSADVAVTAARQAAAGDVAGAGMDCRDLQVDVDTAAFTAGGVVRVTVHCTADLSALTFSGLPGSKTLSASAAAPLETYRTVTP